MSIKLLNYISNLVEDEGIFYIASGKLTQNILQSIVNTTRYGVYNSDTNKEYSDVKISNLINTIIEMVQNVSKHKEEIENYHHDLVLITTKNHLNISTSNLANTTNKDQLTKRIDTLNSLDAKGLKGYLKQSIRENRDKDENSSGLGLIEIAILSKNNIEYNASKYNHFDDVFKIDITVNL